MRQHRRAVEGHPRGAVRLLEVAPGRQRLAAVEHADVVEAEEAAAEHVLAVQVLLLTHHVKLSSSLWNARLRNGTSRSPRRPVIL